MKVEKVGGYNNIYQVDCFQKEFEKAVSETKATGRYHKWLRNKLNVLDSLGKEAIRLEYFEKLKDSSPNLYSIRYPHSKKNPRVIYIYMDGSKVCLLNAFLECDNSDYIKGINLAEKRAKLFI